MKCTKMDPDDRIQNAKELKAELLKLTNPNHKKKIFVATIFTVLVLGLSISSYFVFEYRKNEPANTNNTNAVTTVESTNTTETQPATAPITEAETSETTSYNSQYNWNVVEQAPSVTKRGNSVGNISNGGIAAIQEDWIYYSAANNSDDKTSGAMYRVKNDDSDKEKICDDYATYINVASDYIYYSNQSDNNKLYRIKTDGTSREKLNDDKSLYINIVDDWIYFANGSSNNYLYKIKLDGTNSQAVNSTYSANISVIDDNIYFSTNREIKSMKTDGSGEKIICEEQLVKCINIVGDWIYYSHDGGGVGNLYRIKTDGTAKQKLDVDLFASWLNVKDDYIYYNSCNFGEFTNRKLHRVKTDGSDKQKLSDLAIVSNINIVGDWVYYINSSNETCRIKMDGSNNQILNN